MKLCLITPIKNLIESKNGGLYFALTRQLKENNEYYKFFYKRKTEGNEVIVDNNIHEKDPMDFENHVELALRVGTIIVVPDVMRDKKKTLEYFHYFMDKFYKKLKEFKIKILAVPQGETFEEIKECLIEMSGDDRVDMIGNSFDLTPFKISSSKYDNQSSNRFLIMNMFLQNTSKPIHMLGSNNLWEIYFFSKFKQVYSTDGKIFSRLSLNNQIVDKDNWKTITKPEIKMGFNDSFTEKQTKQYIKNVEFFKKVMEE